MARPAPAAATGSAPVDAPAGKVNAAALCSSVDSWLGGSGVALPGPEFRARPTNISFCFFVFSPKFREIFASGILAQAEDERVKF